MEPNDPNDETVDPFELDSEAGNQDQADADGGEAIDETIEFRSPSEQSTTEIPSHPTEETRVFAGRGSESDESDSNSGIEETVGPDSFSDPANIVRPFGIGEQPGSGDADSDDADDDIDKTVPAIEATIDMATVRLRPKSHETALESDEDSPQSVMMSADVSQTIDPRALSKEDAAFWGSAAIGASDANHGEQSKLRPAVERSISETKLQIRQRDLAVPTREKDASADYRLVRLLGRGGMGNVYVARQSSLDRMIAVKVIKPLSKEKRQSLQETGRLEHVEHERRQQFLSEAVVTGDLDHPNIVPIHDIAVAADNTLFYAMKRVVGQPWSKTIDDTTRDENLEILLKVCDAIAFAHTRGVIHRDIKPENIMLGDFGEVLVMDWGLAIAKPEFEKKESITFNAGLGGTPAFMAPEMALGPVDSIGPHSDIYLLGATLFYIVVGHAPHRADNVSQCIRAVAKNEIESPPAELHGELLDIALKAMATNASDRYVNVVDFQKAIRSYRSHSESIALSTAAEAEYRLAKSTSRYESYSRATHGFEQAIALWAENQPAKEGLDRCRLDHATAAYENGDYDLGLSLLDVRDPRHRPLIDQLNEGLSQRELRASRLKLFRRVAVASLLFILVGGSAALFIINEKRKEENRLRGIAEEREVEADTQRGLAEKGRAEAEAATKVAEEQRDRAETAEGKAEERLAEVERQKALVEDQKSIAEANAVKAKNQEMLAVQNAKEAREQEQLALANERIAIAALKRAQYESYLSQIGLAKARIDGNEFDDARAILTSIRKSLGDRQPAWEWRYLWQQANQARSVESFLSGVTDADVGPEDRFVVVVLGDGTVERRNLVTRDPVAPHVEAAAPRTWQRRDLDATCTATGPSGRFVAVGTRGGRVLILDADDGQISQEFDGHDGTVNDIQAMADGRLLTASSDRTISLWDARRRETLATCWHIGPVVQVSVRQPSTGPTIVLAAVSERKSGRVVGWNLQATATSGNEFSKLGVYSGHSASVRSVALNDQGDLAASADARGSVHLWQVADLQRTDYRGAIKNAIATLDNDESIASRLVTSDRNRFPASRIWQAHDDAVEVLRFVEDGQTLLTGADDYTIAGWGIDDVSRQYTLRGHGGWVRAIVPSKSERGIVFSGSLDKTVRTWDTDQAKLVAASELVEQRDLSTDLVRKSQLHDDEILAARLDRSGRRLISASRDHSARILGIDPKTMSFREIAEIDTRQSGAEELKEGTEFLAMSAQVDGVGRRLFVGSADSTVRIWDIESGTQWGSVAGTGLNKVIALSKDGTRLVTGSSRKDAKALVWDVSPNGAKPRMLYPLDGHQQAVTAFAVSDDGKLIATGDRAGRCRLWDGASGDNLGEPVDLFLGFRINQLAISDDGRSLWIASDSGLLAQVDLVSRETVRTLEHDGFVNQFSFSPTGDQVVTVSSESANEVFSTTATWWDLQTLSKQILDRVEAALDSGGQTSGSTARINSASFGPGGDVVVICRQGQGGRTGQVTLHTVPGQSSETFELPSRIGPPELGLLTENQQLITLNGEAAIRWSLQGLKHEKSYRPHAAVVEARFSPDGRLAATASRSLRLWETQSGAALDKLENPHGAAMTSMDFTQLGDDQRYLFATAANESVAKLWSWQESSGFRLV